MSAGSHTADHRKIEVAEDGDRTGHEQHRPDQARPAIAEVGEAGAVDRDDAPETGTSLLPGSRPRARMTLPRTGARGRQCGEEGSGARAPRPAQPANRI